jgi:protein-tyrosine phosphatase
VRGFVDLHCHWISAIDDGARSAEAGIAMLRGLRACGFDTVVATPHMRPGMFENDRAALVAAFAAMEPHLARAGAAESGGRASAELPRVHLASEHWFDDVVFDRLRRGQGLPYPGGTAALIELPPEAFPMNLQARFVDLKRAGLRVVLAHPERYQPVWKDDQCLDPLFDAGALLLLDVCSLVGKYGRRSQAAAEKLLGEEAYEAACSDAHKPEDCETVARAIERLESLAGKEEAYRLLAVAPRAILGQKEQP